MATKEIRKLVKSLQEQGWRVDQLKSGHYRAYSPSGKGIVHIAGTPSDHRDLANTLARLRKLGYKG